MTKAQHKASKFAALLALAVSTTFQKAFAMRAVGQSEDEILIDYDIQAAASTQVEEITQTGRSTIRAAVRAFDSGMPFFLAHFHVMSRVNEQIENILDEIARKEHHTRRTSRRTHNTS